MTPLLYVSDAYLLGLSGWLLAGLLSLIALLKLRRRWRGADRKETAANAGLSLWFLLAALTLPEIYVAGFYDTTDSYSLTNVSRRWYQMHVATNAAGFRDRKPFPNKVPDDKRRIGFVGDSFTFGHGIADRRDRFSDRIAKQLQPGEFFVSNLALPGLGARRFCDGLLRPWVRNGVEIDLLVYTFVPNDIESFDERTALHYQRLEELKPRFVLFRDTYFYNLLYYRLLSLRRPALGGYYDYLRDSYRSDAWNRLEMKLDEILALCKKNGTELRMVLFPFLQNLGEDYPFAEAHRRLSRFCEEHDVRYLDLRPILRRHNDERLTVSRFDAHPNRRAHRLAAAAIRKHLLDDLFRTSATRR